MKGQFKTVSWIVLILGWVIAVVACLIFDKTPAAGGLAIVAVCTWIAWAYFLGWLFGIRRRLRRHFGTPLTDVTLLAKSVSAPRVNDVRRAMEFLYADKGTANQRRYGVFAYGGFSLATLLHAESETAPLQWLSVESREGHYETFPQNGLYLLYYDGRPFAAHLGSTSTIAYSEEGDSTATSGVMNLEVLACSLEDARRVIDHLLQAASANSVYRGMMLHVTSPGRGHQAITVAERPVVDAQRIVLPGPVLQVLGRTIAARLEFHRLLLRHGHSSKTGILLHGPPGTGKTLVAKHLIGACQNHTAIVPMGMEAETIREAFRLAAYLQPALIVIEDVDLLAERRETNANVTGLQELMNEMDGLGTTAEAIVLMTTNRPEVLEPALAARPGRVSQAISFPLPDAALRLRLLTLFCSVANVRASTCLGGSSAPTGASPAFLEELAKRAILFAAQRLESPAHDAEIHLADADFDQAIHELVVFGGILTSNLLGFPMRRNDVL